ncbi:23S rRNA (cytosine1962-C5)-methyltransferase [Bathymodiolus japonicus methanotrophic gill symbiont]|uniref:class I SAM-dependent rRNA methyltransferase n=1 Tax=Bathymodiolus japonicus methanotrophic gill symbiont TaxID=113269 RepID=UPI001B6E23A3|nr:class I SAM-dependent rRNA methyltransferase [Bathymodiolus japonicus methanotrophic gill symbiont]GFO72393.1 23S rRNA (cytosine1962-C5)-methyltransferase [Bathymodiolus japonicus methanotrophic gill symbiont]
MAHPELFLKKNEDKRLRKGHLWVFSNEVDIQRSPLNQFAPGDMVKIVASNGQIMGSAYINPGTLVCARLLSKKPSAKLGAKMFTARISRALALRERFYDKSFYRLIFGESDGLPGLVIDRFGDVLSVQITTAGIERQKEPLVKVLIELLQPQAILLKNDNPQRELEGLSTESVCIYGEIPEQLIIEENNAQFKIDIVAGQKTGWFYDHRSSRALLAPLAKDKTVLDLFSYTGGWGIPAALHNAQQVTCVDASAGAIKLAEHNAHLNQVSDNMQFIQSDVFDYLKQARLEKRRFDIVILDPPALIKRKKDFKTGYEAYRRLNHLALQVLAKDGILVSASCSYHLSKANLHEILRSSARHIDRNLTIVATGGQAADHPIHPAISETEYLTSYFCAVSESL